MNNKYPIDATIISILFDIRDEEKANEAYKKFADLQERFFDKSLVDYLLGKGVTEEKLKEFFEAKEPEEYPEIADLYKTEEFFLYSAEKSNEFNKRLYDERLPLLKEENKNALVSYLKELDQDITKNTDTLMTIMNRNINPDGDTGMTDQNTPEQTVQSDTD